MSTDITEDKGAPRVYFITFYNNNYRGSIIGLYRKLMGIFNEREANFYVEAYDAIEALKTVKELQDFDYSKFTGFEMTMCDEDIHISIGSHKFVPVYVCNTNEGKLLKPIESINNLIIPTGTSYIGLYTDKAWLIKYGTHGY